MKFIKKPVEIEAVQFTMNSLEDIRNVIDFIKESDYDISYLGEGKIYIETLEGVMCANDGDWIIKGIKGEFYPCKPDIFEATYEKVNENKN
jgi:hypothetical protein